MIPARSPLLPVVHVWFSVMATAALASESNASRAEMKFFENDVRPVLAKRCYGCHGEQKQKGGLRMDGIGFLKKGGDTGPAIVPGDPDKSLLIEAVRYANSDLQMPPENKGGKTARASSREEDPWAGFVSWFRAVCCR